MDIPPCPRLAGFSVIQVRFYYYLGLVGNLPEATCVQVSKLGIIIKLGMICYLGLVDSLPEATRVQVIPS